MCISLCISYSKLSATTLIRAKIKRHRSVSRQVNSEQQRASTHAFLVRKGYICIYIILYIYIYRRILFEPKMYIYIPKNLFLTENGCP